MQWFSWGQWNLTSFNLSISSLGQQRGILQLSVAQSLDVQQEKFTHFLLWLLICLAAGVPLAFELQPLPLDQTASWSLKHCFIVRCFACVCVCVCGEWHQGVIPPANAVHYWLRTWKRKITPFHSFFFFLLSFIWAKRKVTRICLALTKVRVN